MTASVDRLAATLRDEAESQGLSGVLVVDEHGRRVFEYASGLADRAESRPMTVDTRLATASGTKGFTALATVSLIEDGALGFDTRLSEVVGDLLPAVDGAVTIEHLLGHTAGVGDYLDEETLGDIDDQVLDIPVDELEGPSDYLPLLNRHPQADVPGERFRYNNSGFVMLALIIELVTGEPYHDVVRRRVFEPAEMASTGSFRSDRMPTGSALGYLADGRTNVFHLPVIGTGDGGAFTTAPDMMEFWDAVFAGRIVAPALVDRMTTVDESVFGDWSPTRDRYGLGFWIAPDRTTVMLEGMDAGVSFRSGANPTTGLRFCLVANNSSDVWPLAKTVDRFLRDGLEIPADRRG